MELLLSYFLEPGRGVAGWDSWSSACMLCAWFEKVWFLLCMGVLVHDFSLSILVVVLVGSLIMVLILDMIGKLDLVWSRVWVMLSTWLFSLRSQFCISNVMMGLHVFVEWIYGLCNVVGYLYLHVCCETTWKWTVYIHEVDSLLVQTC